MSTTVLPRLECPRCGHVAAGVRPGTACPHDDGFVLVDPAERVRAGDDPLLGRLLSGRYAILGLLGRGGMGAVYTGLQLSVSREVAIKVILPDARRSPEIAARFGREARALARLSHENVVVLFDHGQDDDGTLYLVMERLRGETLGEMLRRRRGLPVDEAVRILRPVLSALGAAHRLGLVHRDLKPDNIMLVPGDTGQPRVKVLDFGIVKAMEADLGTLQTAGSIVLGTPLYMSPEQAVGTGVGPATDLYAAGVILYQMLAGAPPFGGETPYAVLECHRHAAVPPLPPERAIPAAIETIVRRALEKAPAARFADAEEMTRALEAATAPAAAGPSTGVRVSADAATLDAVPDPPPTLIVASDDDSSVLSAQRTSQPLERSETRRLSRGWLVAALALVGAGFVVSRFAGSEPPSSPPPAAVVVTATVSSPAVVPASRPAARTDAPPAVVQTASPTPPDAGLGAPDAVPAVGPRAAAPSPPSARARATPLSRAKPTRPAAAAPSAAPAPGPGPASAPPAVQVPEFQ